MEKQRQEMLEKLRTIKKTAQKDIKKNHPGYEQCKITDVIHYNKKVELVNKRTGKKVEFDLCVALAQDPETKDIWEMYYLDGKELDFEELMRKYESPYPIKDVIDATEENKEKPEKEQDKKLRTDSLEELNEPEKEGKSAKKEKDKDKEEKIIPEFRTDKSGATSLDQMIDGVTLRNILKLSGEYECIKPVSASKLKGYANVGNKDAIVAIKRNGECTVLDESVIRLDRQEGKNSFNQDLNINNDGSVEYKSNTSSYQIVGRPNYYISIGYDEGTSKKEIKLSKRSGREGSREVEFELHKYGAAEYEESDARKLRQENEDGIEKSESIANKQKEHEELGCENDRVENIDNYAGNNIHAHGEFTKESIVPGEEDKTIEEWADELGESVKAVIERLNKEIEDDPERDLEDIVKEIEYDYGMMERNRDRI